MIRRPPRSTRTDTLFPYTTLFRSAYAPSQDAIGGDNLYLGADAWVALPGTPVRSEEHTSELQSLMRISYAVFCLKKKTCTQPTLISAAQLTQLTYMLNSELPRHHMRSDAYFYVDKHKTRLFR